MASSSRTRRTWWRPAAVSGLEPAGARCFDYQVQGTRVLCNPRGARQANRWKTRSSTPAGGQTRREPPEPVYGVPSRYVERPCGTRQAAHTKRGRRFTLTHQPELLAQNGFVGAICASCAPAGRWSRPGLRLAVQHVERWRAPWRGPPPPASPGPAPPESSATRRMARCRPAATGRQRRPQAAAACSACSQGRRGLVQQLRSGLLLQGLPCTALRLA